MSKKEYWWKPRVNGKYKGSYERDKDGERVFTLRRIGPLKRKITFESWQMAKKLGWVKS